MLQIFFFFFEFEIRNRDKGNGNILQLLRVSLPPSFCIGGVGLHSFSFLPFIWSRNTPRHRIQQTKTLAKRQFTKWPTKQRPLKKGNEKWQLRCGIFPVVWIPSRLLRRWQWWPVLWHHTTGRSDLAIISRFIPETISTSLRADLVYKVCFSLFGPGGGGWEIYWIGSGGFGAYFCYSCRHPIRIQQKTHSHHIGPGSVLEI